MREFITTLVAGLAIVGLVLLLVAVLSILQGQI